MWKGHAWQGGIGVCMTGEMAIAGGDTQPTGMHSCLYVMFSCGIIVNMNDKLHEQSQ